MEAAILTAILGLGSMALVNGVLKLFAKSQAIEAPAIKVGGPFASLDPQRGMQDRFEIFLVEKMGLGKSLEALHVQLGKPEEHAPLKLLRKKELTAVVGLVALLAVSKSVPLALFGMFIGFNFPDASLKGQVRKRQKAILQGFPAMVDLAALTIESGLDYMAAFAKIVSVAPKKTAVELELEKTINEVELGYTRPDALRHFADRTGLQEVRSFVGLIIQSDELGTSLVGLLRSFSADLRFRRLTQAEQLAAQASTKMLFPIMIFIFPTVFLLMLSPMIMNLVTGGMPF
ncbi:MAG: type II secretion system F family protein [Elusimicrobia bacterium]|nr:type II secretion system F family protein [Elusimicrobiota bacterium]